MKNPTTLIRRTIYLSVFFKFLFSLSTATAQITERLSLNLYAHNLDGTTSLNDGTVTDYHNFYSNFVDMWDALKVPQIAESISFSRSDTAIAIERRKIIPTIDTSYIRFSNAQQKNYKFEIIAANLNHPGLTGVLQDAFTHFYTPLNLNGTTVVEFAVTTSPASAATNRFQIVFITSSPLPVDFTNASAIRNNNGIAINWSTANEINLQQFDVERSENGRDFSVMQQVAPLQNNRGNAQYSIQDTKAVTGMNFYRVRAISIGGRIQYSPILKVAAANGTANQITVYPNPVRNNNLSLQFVNMPKGVYNLQLTNGAGMVMQTGQLNHNGANAGQTINLNKAFVSGYYHLQILLPNGEKQVQTVLVAQ